MEKEFINGYRRMGIDIEPLEDGTVKVTQARLINGYILNQKQLIERGKNCIRMQRLSRWHIL